MGKKIWSGGLERRLLLVKVVIEVDLEIGKYLISREGKIVINDEFRWIV